MKRFIKNISGNTSRLVMLALLVSIGCQDFLDKKPQGQLLQSSFPVSPSDALLVTNAAYAYLRAWSFHSGGYPILDIMSDDARKGSSPGDQLSNIGPYDNFTINQQQDGLDRWWSAAYQTIRASNVVIANVKKITLSDSVKNQYLGEARFLRALTYFDIVRAWGNVQLVTVPEPPLDLANATADQIYTQIIEDFTFAANHLPKQSFYNAANLGRATKGAANAYLAKVYLFKKDFINAEKYALEVINSGQYSLEPDFNNANGLAGNFGVESIFEIGALPLEGNDNGGDQFANTQGVRGSPNRGWGFNRPSYELINSFEANDPRKDATVIFLKEVMPDGVLIIGDGSAPDTTKVNGVITEIECYNQKVWTPGTTPATQWGHHRRLMRYADVLLIAAEASNENSKTAQALTNLNKVRLRARGGNVAILPNIVETNKDLLRDIILNERRHELALEGHRFWDLLRTGKAPAVLGPLGFTSKYNVMPIPQTQIDISQNRLKQNSGW
ncbi:RagB/SusD family nutrient uptake outer membrane protein [soil metagenome]